MSAARPTAARPQHARRALAAGVAALTGAGAAAAAAAAPNDFEIQASNVAALKVGATFERGAAIAIPPGGSITLIDRTGASLRTRQCAGRYEGPVDKCPPPPAGGTSRTTPGGARGVQP